MGPIRAAGSADLAAVSDCVQAAFGPYVAAIGKPPAPMLADYHAAIGQGRVFVLEETGALAGLLVLEPRPDELFVDVLAVRPECRRMGVGRRLMAFAEAEARRLGLPGIRLYTHEVMAEALAFYAALGYQELERVLEEGYARVYLSRSLAPH
jgi:ribosomal protein S18 acetylase RimI-like enzyme